MSLRRSTNPGKHERAARKRHRRASLWCGKWGAAAEPLRLGREHYRRLAARDFKAVADAEKPGAADRYESARETALT